MSKNTIIAIAAGAALLAAAAYLLLKPSTAPVVVETAPQSPAEVTFVSLASQLEPLGFDTSILSDPRFMSLVDIHTTVLPETPGHADPFSSR